MQNLLEELAKYHDEWIKIAYAFFNNKEDAEDLVQDFYIDRFKDGGNFNFIIVTMIYIQSQ